MQIYREPIISDCDITPARRARHWGKPLLLKRAERRHRLATADYARLAAFRGALRQFLRFSEEAAARAGLTSQHYQAMLILRARGDDGTISINELAGELLIRHNSAVGLVDRLEGEKLVARVPSAEDRRKVGLKLSARGRTLLGRLAAIHRRELERIAPALEQLVAEAAGGGRYNEGEPRPKPTPPRKKR